MEPLQADDIAARMAGHPDWDLVDGDRLRREITLGTFVDAFGVMAQVAVWAEKLDHHPEWSNVYNRLTIELTTHDAGGVTARDFALASHVDAIVSRFDAG